MCGISKSTVSRLFADIDDRVKAFLEWPIEGDWRSPSGSNRWHHDRSPVDQCHPGFHRGRLYVKVRQDNRPVQR
jgi:hypothetical protein